MPQVDYNHIAQIVHDNVQYWAEVLDWDLRVRLDQMEKKLMATLAEAVAADEQLLQDVQAIETQLSSVEAQLAALQSAGLTAEQQAQVDQITTDLTNMHASILGALNPPAPPAG